MCIYIYRTPVVPVLIQALGGARFGSKQPCATTGGGDT